MLNTSPTKPHNLIDTRLHGTRMSAFLRELLSNSGHFLIFNVLSEISLFGWRSYLTSQSHYLITIALCAQAWYLSRPKANRFWGNFIGPTIYTLTDLPLDGLEFFQEPNHLILWIFCLAIATLQGLRCHWTPGLKNWIVPLESFTRSGMLISLYVILKIKAEHLPLSGAQILDIFSTAHHQFFLESTIAIGLLVGLQTLQVSQQQEILQETAVALRNLAQWGLGTHVVSTAIADPDALGFQRRDRAIVFLDVRGFTHWCEQTAPDRVAQVLNTYYNGVEPAAAEFDPLRITLTADEVMAIYPTVEQAVNAAQKMRDAAIAVLSSHGLGAGCAIHYGSAIEGLFGSEDVRTYTAIGDVVNTAKRIESATPAGEITISDAVYRQLGDRAIVEPCEAIAAKGKSEPIAVWRLLEWRQSPDRPDSC
ncbi:adenylate/guanylate cyclase domain-containing protein [Oxynema aestuarii]|nr:adenylate/guanylate cyclase domain-containing protein [Oxynema aestuarii]